MASRQNSNSASSRRFSPFRQAFTFQLSLISLLGICLVALIGAGWIFAFGVIIGRGFEPEQQVPVLGRLAPPAAEAPGSPDAPDANGGIIKAEDLTFHDALKTQPTLSTDQPASSPARPEGRQADPKKPERSAQRPASGQASGQTSGQTSGQASGPASGPTTLEPRYNFVFQVIAYKNAERAEAFRTKLETAGLRTRLQVEKDKQGNPRIYRVQVLLNKATDAEAERTREVLSRNGAKAPTVTRKPI